MAEFEQIGLELLEYKVQDLLANRRIEGGPGAAWELYRSIVKRVEVFSPGERQRFEDATRILRLFAEVTKSQIEAPSSLSDLRIGEGEEPIIAVIDHASNDESPEGIMMQADVREEQAILRSIARKVWWDDLEEFIIKVAAGWRAERDRLTARLIYATLRNLSRYSGRKTFIKDVNLRNFTIEEGMPERNDALVSFNDLESLAEIVREVVNLVMTLGKPSGSYPDLQVSENGALDYIKRSSLSVAQDPYAGSLTAVAHQGPSSKQLRLAIQELSKERLPDDQRSFQRRELEHRLSETLALERNQRQLYQRDILHFNDLVHAFFERLANHLPTSVGGNASGPQLRGGILFAANPALRWESVPPDVEAVSVRVIGPVRFVLEDIEVAIMGSEGSRMLFLGDKEYPLKPRMSIEVDDRTMLVYYESGYLHLRVSHRTRSLASMVAEALTVFFVLSSDHREGLLTVLKIVANTLQGEPQDLVSRAVARAAEVSATAPSRRQAIEGLFKGAARAAGVVLEENILLGMVQRFHTAMTVGPLELASMLEQSDELESTVYQLTGEPLTIDIAGLKLTVRQYRGREDGGQSSLVAMLPGQVLGSFSDYLLEPLNGGTLMCVRGEQEIAILFVKGLPVESSRAV